MTHIFLFGLFLVLFASRALDLDTSLAPGLSVKNAFLYLVFLSLAIETAVTRRRQLELMPVFVPFTAYVGYAIFSWVVVLLLIDYPGYSPWSSLMSLKAGPVEDLLVLLVFFYGVLRTPDALWLLQAMTWAVVVGNILTVFQGAGLVDLGMHLESDGRVGGTIGPVNQFGAFVAFTLPFAVATYMTSKGFLRFAAGAGLLFSGIAFLMAMSRGAIVGLIVGAILGAYYLRSVVSARLLIRAATGIAILGALVVLGVVLAGFGELLVGRFSEMGGSAHEATSGRTMIWGKAIATMLNHPISLVTGFGWYAYDTDSPSGWATHSVYLYILYNLGAIGLLLFFIVVGNALRIARSAISEATVEVRPWLVAFVFGFLALLVAIAFGNFHVPWLYVWAFAGISLRLAAAAMSAEAEPGAANKVRVSRLGGVRTVRHRQPQDVSTR